jgi:hypothetical protein
MRCAECGRPVGAGTRAFTTRVIVEAKGGFSVTLCGSCAAPGQPVIRRWAAMETKEGLFSLSGTVFTGFR